MRRRIDWQRHVENQPSSGLNITDYCKKYNLAQSQFFQHRKKSRGPTMGNFAEVSIKPSRKEKVFNFSLTITGDDEFKFSGSTNDKSLLGLIFGGNRL